MVAVGQEAREKLFGRKGRQEDKFVRKIKDIFRDTLEENDIPELLKFKNEMEEAIRTNMNVQFSSFLDRMKEVFYTFSMKISHMERKVNGQKEGEGEE